MNLFERLRVLSQQAAYEGEDEVLCPHPRGPLWRRGLLLYRAAVGGRRVVLLKTLLTSACERDCAYCPFRAGRTMPRYILQPEELAAGFMQLYRAGVVEGLFLSSGIAGGGQATQDRLLAAAELLRRRWGYRGYLHLKLMPGADREQVWQAMRLADRISVNLEAPGARFLQALAPHKRFWGELHQLLRWVVDLQRNHEPAEVGRRCWPSVTTQFVVGPAGESDRDLLTLVAQLQREVGLQRAYFSPFRPVPGTPLENHPAEDPQRARRLLEASFLLRDYGFSPEELPWDARGNLPRAVDPKTAWALRHLRERPVELNTAPRELLLRVPGLGPRSVARLLLARRQACLREVDQLRALGLPVERMAPFVLLDGKPLPHTAPLPGLAL